MSRKKNQTMIPEEVIIAQIHEFGGDIIKMSQALETDYSKLKQRINHNTSLRDALDYERDLKRAEIENALFEKAKGGDRQAQIHWLEHNYEEVYGKKSTVEINNKTVSVSVNVQKALDDVPLDILLQLSQGKPITQLPNGKEKNVNAEIIGEEIQEEPVE